MNIENLKHLPDQVCHDLLQRVSEEVDDWNERLPYSPTKEQVAGELVRKLVSEVLGLSVNYPDPVDVISEKAAYWFNTLAKCVTALNLPSDEPIPTGVLNGVKATQEALEAAKKRLLQITYEGPIDSVSTASKGLFDIDQALNRG